jgi:hypothetical protein
MTPSGWRGTNDELHRLRLAVERYCTCSDSREEDQVCPSHALLTDEYVLDHLVYIYRTKARLVRAEWSGPPEPSLHSSISG